jgi:predicted TIM-barrel fold metal-dependent hydrolase
MDKIFDSHVHVGRHHEWIPEGLELATELGDHRACEVLEHDDDAATATAAYLKEEGVTFAAAIPPGRQAVQEGALDFIEPTGGFLLPFVQYDPRSAPEAPASFEQAIARGARGLKVHPCSHQLPPNDRSLYPVYEVARANNIPVMIHVGSSIFPGAKMKFCDPMLVDEVAADFPTLQIICAHSGRGFWTDQVYSLTKMRRNVWMELSGIPPKRIMQYFPEIDRVADRVIWGSDWPSSPAPSVLIRQMRELPLSSDIIEAFLWSNADGLFKLS